MQFRCFDMQASYFVGGWTLFSRLDVLDSLSRLFVHATREV